MDDWKAQKFKFDSQFLLQNPRLVYMPAKVSKHKRTQKLSSDRWLVSLVNFPGNFWVLFSITNVNDETFRSNAEVSLNAKWNRNRRFKRIFILVLQRGFFHSSTYYMKMSFAWRANFTITSKCSSGSKAKQRSFNNCICKNSRNLKWINLFHLIIIR